MILITICSRKGYVNIMNNTELPLSFVMALAQNQSAMKQFEGFTEQQKQSVVDKARKINSKQDMRSFVNHFSEDSLSM